MTTTTYNIPPGQTVAIGAANSNTLVINGGSTATYGVGGGVLDDTHDANGANITVNGGIFELDHDANGAVITLNSASFTMASGHDLNQAILNYGTGMSEVVLSPKVSSSQNFESATFNGFNSGDRVELEGVTNITGLSYSGGRLTFSGTVSGTIIHYNINLSVAPGAATIFFAGVDPNTGLWYFQESARPKTISSSTTGPVILSASDNPVTITSTGTVTSTGSADGIDGGTGTSWTISNAGVVSASGGNGVSLAGSGIIGNTGSISGKDALLLLAGGSVTNVSGASISGQGTLGAGIYITGGAGTVTNAGSISGPNHHAVLIGGGGSLSNLASGVISALNTGVFFQNQPGTLMNAGQITATGADGTGVYLENGGSITNASTGIITGHKFGIFLEGAATKLANYGSISGTTYDGVVLGLGGSVTNAAGASISGASGGVYIKYRAAGTVTNSGNISATGTGGAGIDLADGGSVTNNSTGSVSGTNFGVFITGAAGNVANTGSITSTKYGAVDIAKGGSVTNSAGGSIVGGSVGVYVGVGASGTITNSGIITAANAIGTGVDLAGGGSVTNNSGGSISGGGFGVFTTGALATLSNSGSISGSHAVDLEAGGSVTNAASASIAGQVAGVFSQGAAVTLSNTGGIVAAAGAGADIEAGGSITNLAGATLSGSAFGIFLTGGSGTVTNAGTISGGTYAIDFAGSGTNRLVIKPGAVFVGEVTGGSGTSTLELASGTGSIGGVGTGSFNHFQVLAVDAGATWTFNGANIAPTVLDNGAVSIAGSLDVTTAIDPSSTGIFQLASGATLEVAADTGTTTQINFQGSSELIIDNAASFGTNVGTISYAGPQLQHFVSGDTIDIKNFSSAGVTFNYNASTGVLQVSNSANQVADLEFQTSSLGGTFAATSDGATGILITDPPPQATLALAVDEDKVPEPPTLSVTSTALTVQAGGSVPLGITATPVDPDDSVSVAISGVPSYETITTPGGDSVASQLESSTGTYTWTITESASATGTVLSGLTLSSQYTGTGYPVATLAVIASDMTSGETATSVAQTVTVTDPPAATSSISPGSMAMSQGSSAPPSAISLNQIAAVFDQFVAAGFHNTQAPPGIMASTLQTHCGFEDPAFLSRPHHSA